MAHLLRAVPEPCAEHVRTSLNWKGQNSGWMFAATQ